MGTAIQSFRVLNVNVKLLKHDKDAVWDYFEGGVQDFGPSVLLIPEEE